MDTDRTALADTACAQPPVCGPCADPGPRGAHRHSLRTAQWHSLAHVAAGDGLRLRDHLLAAAGLLAAGGRVEAAPCRAPRRVTSTRPAGSGPRGGGQRVIARDARGKKTGPNPTDRRKAGSKHHVLTDANGIPLVATLTAANRPDITQLLDLVDAIPPIGGRPGPPPPPPPGGECEP